MSRTGSRTALISTRPLRLPSASSFPLSVQLKPGKLPFLNWILTVYNALLYFLSTHARGLNVNDVLFVPIWESGNSDLRVLMFSKHFLMLIHENYAGTSHIWIVSLLFQVRCPSHHLTFNYLINACIRISFCCIVLVCVSSNNLMPIACRTDADSEREAIFSGCLLIFCFMLWSESSILFDSCLQCFNYLYLTIFVQE